MNQAEPHPVRLLTQVAIPYDKVLAEGEISPKGGESEAQLSEVVEVALGDEIVSAEEFPPRHRDQREARYRGDPSPHEHPPAVHRALEMRVERHRQIPRQQDPAIDECEAEPDRELPLQRVRGVNLAPLVPKTAPHSFAEPARPAGARFGGEPDVETHRRIDVPYAQRDDDKENG